MIAEPKLREVDDAWLESWQSLVSGSEWLAKKVNRSRRWGDHVVYAKRWLPHLWTATSGTVLDIGPGMGELLELATVLGHSHLGVDSPSGDGGMGTQYLQAAKLMHKRQGLAVSYKEFLLWLDSMQSLALTEKCVAINSRGSIEQVFARFMEGVPHDKHHRASEMTWVLSPDCWAAIDHLMKSAAELLRHDGVLLIHANGSKNHAEYVAAFTASAESAGLRLIETDGDRIHKWGKKR